MHALARFTFASTFVLALASLACTAPVDETSLVASFVVEGSLDQNTCGSQAIPELPDPWTRRAELRRSEAGLYYWRELGTGVQVQGTKAPNGELRFRASSTRTLIAAEPSLGYPGCNVHIEDELRFVLEGGPGDAADAGMAAGYFFAGRQVSVISIAAGSDCWPALNANGGNFLALPCSFAFDLEGEEE
ncbi:MAG: hypothetical protein H5U40_00590 [Polyangiaceae bacterium]|nr:hypothetical protein [Polyangiaceae bacterium]